MSVEIKQCRKYKLTYYYDHVRLKKYIFVVLQKKIRVIFFKVVKKENSEELLR